MSDHHKMTKSRITMLRELLDLSQKDFAQGTGISQSALSQLESGKSHLSLDTLQKMSESYEVNCNWLVHGKGAIFFKKDTNNDYVRSPAIITRNENGATMIPLILEEAQAGYAKGHKDAEYLSTLEIYKVPGYEEGNYRMFEINGDSMVPAIQPREIVVSEYVEDWRSLENGTMCIVITSEDIVAKRVYFYEEDLNVLILKSDNAKFKTYTLNLDDIIEIWEIKAKITSFFATHNPENTDDRLIQMQNDLEELKRQMLELVKHKN